MDLLYSHVENTLRLQNIRAEQVSSNATIPASSRMQRTILLNSKQYMCIDILHSGPNLSAGHSLSASLPFTQIHTYRNIKPVRWVVIATHPSTLDVRLGKIESDHDGKTRLVDINRGNKRKESVTVCIRDARSRAS
jgi:hypothetical protein